ncbi:MAG TPA: AMIN domain-containing protein [Dongiaceae bacterium]|nr:AMIN domain-containing protein [Dongiaceae bacterium]
MKRLLAVLFLLVPGTALAAPRVSEARLSNDGAHARLELTVSGAPDFHVFYLANPYRIVIDMDAVDWRAALPPRSIGDGPVSNLRHGVQKSGAARLVLDLAVPARISSAHYQAGTKASKRLVIDVRQVSAANFAAAMIRRQPTAKAVDEAANMQTAAGQPANDRSGGNRAGAAPRDNWAAAKQAAGTAAPQASNGSQDQSASQTDRPAKQIYRDPLLTAADADLRSHAQQNQSDPLEYTSPDGYYFSYMRPPGSLFGAGVTVGMQF